MSRRSMRFSSAETSLTTISQVKVRTLIENGNMNAQKLQKVTEQHGKMLSTILIGNNIVNILLEDREATWRRDLESKGCRIVIETEGIGDFESVQRIAMRHIADQIKPEKTVGIKDNGRKSFFRK